MFETGNLGLIARLITEEREPAPAEWLQLIEQRCQQVKPFLRYFQLKTLAEQPVFLDSHETLTLGDHLALLAAVAHTLSLKLPPLLSRDNPVLREKGIYGQLNIPTKEPIKDLAFWGLDRNGQWVVVRLGLEFFPKDSSKPRDPFKVQPLKTEYICFITYLISSPVLLEDMVARTKTNPLNIWLALRDVVYQWYRFREGLFKEAMGLYNAVEFDERLLNSAFQVPEQKKTSE